MKKDGRRSAGKRQSGRIQPSKSDRRKWRRMVVFTLIATASLVAAVTLLKPVSPRKTAAEGRVIDLTADMGGFSAKVIRVRVGETVTVRLTSLDSPFHLDGGGKHQFAIPELGVNIIAPARGTASATFTPDKPGTYTFFCDICCGGKANPTMSGRFIVRA